MEVRQKIAGGFRSLRGAVDLAVIRSFVSTCQRQGKVMQALTLDPESCSADTEQRLLSGAAAPHRLGHVLPKHPHRRFPRRPGPLWAL